MFFKKKMPCSTELARKVSLGALGHSRQSTKIFEALKQSWPAFGTLYTYRGFSEEALCKAMERLRALEADGRLTAALPPAAGVAGDKNQPVRDRCVKKKKTRITNL
jgi:hypothetical protein